MFSAFSSSDNVNFKANNRSDNYNPIKNMKYIENDWENKELEDINTVKFINKYFKSQPSNTNNTSVSKVLNNKEFKDLNFDELVELNLDFKNILMVMERKKKSIKDFIRSNNNYKNNK